MGKKATIEIVINGETIIGPLTMKELRTIANWGGYTDRTIPCGAVAHVGVSIGIKVNEPTEIDGMPNPCQPIGCDNGHHLKGCVYARMD